MDDKKQQGVSWALLVPLLWFLRIASRGITYWLNPEMAAETEIDYLQGSPIDRTFLLILEGLGFAILLTRKIDWLEFLRRNKLLCLFYLYMGISVFWSDFLSVSFKRWIRTIGDLMMVLIVVTDPNFMKAVPRMFRQWAFVLISLSVIFIKYYRHLGVQYDRAGQFEMWVGVTTHKNSLGQLACMSAFFFTWILLSRYFKRLWIFDIPLLLMSLWLLMGSRTATSRTSLGVYFIGLGILIMLLLLKKNVAVTRVTVTVTVWGLFIGNFLVQYLYSRELIQLMAAMIGEDPTLTGRTLLWDELMKIAAQHRYFGSGYGGFWIGNIGNNLWEIFQWNPGQAHNGYLDVYIDLGIVGLVFLTGLIINVYRNVLINLRYDSDYGRYRLALLAMILIYNITESSFIKPTSLLWFLFLMISINIPEPFPEKVSVSDEKVLSCSRRRNQRKRRRGIPAASSLG
jgi:O-antigen ligase